MSQSQIQRIDSKELIDMKLLKKDPSATQLTKNQALTLTPVKNIESYLK